MSRRLYLLRHAKSSWDDSELADHDRPLAPRGIRAAAAIAGYLREHEIQPALVLCSTARRTRETYERLGLDGPVRYEPRIYGASAAELRELVRALPDELESVMLIGHNPAIEELSGEPKFPTGALAVLELDDWSASGATLVAFVRPRDLAQ
jgi:phosphohistidine phosphatase